MSRDFDREIALSDEQTSDLTDATALRHCAGVQEWCRWRREPGETVSPAPESEWLALGGLLS